MPTGTRDGISPSLFRSTLKQLVFGLLPGRKSSHLTEAIAAGCGYGSNAAYLSDVKNDDACTMLPVSRLSTAAMAERLASLASSNLVDEHVAVSIAIGTLSSTMPGNVVPVGLRSKLLANSVLVEQARKVEADDPIAELIHGAIADGVSKVEMKERDGRLLALASIRNTKVDYPRYYGLDIEDLLIWLKQHDYAVVVNGVRHSIRFNAHRGFHVLQFSSTLDGKEDFQLLETIVEQAVERRASHVVLEPRSSNCAIFFKIDGTRELHREIAWSEWTVLMASLAIKSRMDASGTRIPQSGGFEMHCSGRPIDVRVETMPESDGMLAVLRILDPSVFLRFDELGITGAKQWKRGIDRKQGLCLVCGPTASGRTTTVQATIHSIDHRKKVYSVEDQVEYAVPHTGQVTGRPQQGLDFSRAIRSFMRADPDVIVLGEIRTPEQVRNAVKAVASGHLVVAELHAGSIGSALVRLMDLGMSANEMSSTLNSVLVQILVRTVCTNCDGTGCIHCDNSGLKGRTALSEVMTFDGPGQVEAALDLSRHSPRQTLWPIMLDDGFDKAIAGTTTLEQLRRTFGESQVVEHAAEHGIDLAALEHRLPV